MRDIISSELLSGLGDVVGDPGDKLQNILFLLKTSS